MSAINSALSSPSWRRKVRKSGRETRVRKIGPNVLEGLLMRLRDITGVQWRHARDRMGLRDL